MAAVWRREAEQPCHVLYGTYGGRGHGAACWVNDFALKYVRQTFAQATMRGPEPSSGYASTTGLTSAISSWKMWNRADALGNFAFRDQTPERNQQFARQRHDHCLVGLGASIGGSRCKPLG